MADDLSHHGFRRGAPEQPRVQGPPCPECGRPMLGGQKRRHVTCSPVLDCCGHHADGIPDIAKHMAAHAEVAMKRSKGVA